MTHPAMTHHVKRPMAHHVENVENVEKWSEPMKLHEFLSRERDELTAICLHNLHREIPDRSDDELGQHLQAYITEIVGVLRRADGFPEETPDAGPGPADVARDRHRRGFRIGNLVPMYAAISVAVGELGGRQQLAFGAEEYGHFNQAIDHHVAEAIEEFAEDTRREQEHVFGERLGVLAHELRNALASATMAFGMLERGHVGVHGRTADLVHRNHRRMEALIDQTLTAARARSGVKPSLHDVALAALLQDVAASAVAERGIKVTVDADASLKVVGDEQLLASALSNLVQNAIKFSHDGATVIVRARRDGNVVATEVEDECGGLPEGKRDDLFKPFVQRGENRRGVGLGLAIASDAVHALAGEITVGDHPGKGCKFVVRLPSASS